MGGGTPWRLNRPHAARPWTVRCTERLGCDDPNATRHPRAACGAHAVSPPTVKGLAVRGSAATNQPSKSSSSDDSATWAETTASRSRACRSKCAKKAGDLRRRASHTREAQRRAHLHSPARNITASEQPDSLKSWPRHARGPRPRPARPPRARLSVASPEIMRAIFTPIRHRQRAEVTPQGAEREGGGDSWEERLTPLARGKPAPDHVHRARGR